MALSMSTSRVVASRRTVAPRASRGLVVRVQAAAYPQNVAEVGRSFPAKGVATIEEARALLDLGYTYVDVRPTAEIEDQGKLRVCAIVPFKNGKSAYNSATQQREVIKSANPNFVKEFTARFPKKDHKILIACSTGKECSIGALMALEAAGYTHLTGLKGGFLGFSKQFDTVLKRKANAMAVTESTYNSQW
jgi:rhodanese-related sulfurtransferase